MVAHTTAASFVAFRCSTSRRHGVAVQHQPFVTTQPRVACLDETRSLATIRSEESASKRVETVRLDTEPGGARGGRPTAVAFGAVTAATRRAVPATALEAAALPHEGEAALAVDELTLDEAALAVDGGAGGAASGNGAETPSLSKPLATPRPPSTRRAGSCSPE